MTRRLLLCGTLAGLGLAGLAALIEWQVIPARPFGILTLAIGATAGGILLLLALAMSAVSYLLARRGQAILLRRRLLAGAILVGMAGMVGGTTAMLIWAIAGRPLIP